MPPRCSIEHRSELVLHRRHSLSKHPLTTFVPSSQLQAASTPSALATSGGSFGSASEGSDSPFGSAGAAVPACRFSACSAQSEPTVSSPLRELWPVAFDAFPTQPLPPPCFHHFHCRCLHQGRFSYSICTNNLLPSARTPESRAMCLQFRRSLASAWLQSKPLQGWTAPVLPSMLASHMKSRASGSVPGHASPCQAVRLPRSSAMLRALPLKKSS